MVAVVVLVGFRSFGFGVDALRLSSWLSSSISWDKTCDARNRRAASPSSSFVSVSAPVPVGRLLGPCLSAVVEATWPPAAPWRLSGDRDASN